MTPRARLLQRSLWMALGLGLLVYLGSSVRAVAPGEIAVRDSAIFRAAPVALSPGRHLVLRGLFRLTRYAAGRTELAFGGSEPLSFVTPEGSKVLASGRVSYQIDPGRAASLAAESSGDLEGWLGAELRAAIGSAIAGTGGASPTTLGAPGAEAAALKALASRVEPAGLSILALRFERFGYEGSPLAAGPARAGVHRKVLWIGLDSFDWSIADPLLQAGRLPNLKRLMDEGAWGNLQSVPPLLSPVIWTSIATGKRPEKHGIVDFVASDPKTGAVLPVTSTLRKARAFWNIAGDAGVSLGVVAWWASFPAERVEGFMCTDRVAYQLFKGRIKESAGDDPFKTYPADLYRGIAPLIMAPAGVSDAEVSRFIDMGRYSTRFSRDDLDRIDEFRTVLAAAHTYTDIGMKLFSERPTDLRAIYLEGPDTASHLFMPFTPPQGRGIPAEKVAWFGRVVPEFYVFTDELLGRFLERFADADTTVIVNSDHGFKTGDERPETDSRISKGKAADWHARDGIVVLSGKDIRKGGRILGATVLDLVPTLLALYGMPVGQDMDGKVLTAALTDDYLGAHPPATIATYETGEAPSTSQAAFFSEDNQELMAKLESLGYVQQDAPTAKLNEGTIFLQAGEFAKAIAAFESALQKMDEDPVRLNLARAYRLDKQPDKARQQLDLLLKRGYNKAAVLTEMSAMSRERKDWAGAESLLRQALEADPNFAEAHLHFARLYEQQERWEEAAASYRKATALDPKLAEAHNQLGVVLKKLGKTPEAIAAFNLAMKADPDHPGAYNNLGLIYREMGQRDKSRDVLETGVTMAPKSAVLHNSLGSLYYDQGDVDKAVDQFTAALQSDPNYAEAVSNMVTVYVGRKDAAKAAEYLTRLIELEPGNEEARLSLALAQLALSHPDDAARTLGKLVDVSPRNAKALIMLGEIRLRQGQHSEALGFLENASRIDGKIPRAWNSLAQCYLAMGRKDDARQALKRSLGVDPRQPEVTKELARLGG